jgi:hypothetical protein
LITDAHHKTYGELVANTDWSKYGPGNDPRCADCMVHVGFETTPILGAHPRLGDTWTMFKWQMSGKMGGKRFVGQNAGSGRGNGDSGMPTLQRPSGGFIPAESLASKSQDRSLGAD